MANPTPVLWKGTNSFISAIPVVDGNLLFETDQGNNGKIFLDDGTNRLQIGGNYLPSYSATFLSSGWSSSSPYTQTVSVSGVSSDNRMIPTLNTTSATNESNKNNLLLNFSYISYYDSGTNTITATAPFTKPTVDLNVNFIGN